MKTNKLAIALLSVAMLLGACKGKETPEVVTLAGNVAAPEWVAPTDYDYSSSMTAVVKVDLLAAYPESAKDWEQKATDQLAAFIDGECCGVGVLEDDDLFYLYITDKVDAQTPGSVTLKYYSTHYKNLFEATDVFVFQNDAYYGSPTEPFAPSFAVIK